MDNANDNGHCRCRSVGGAWWESSRLWYLLAAKAYRWAAKDAFEVAIWLCMRLCLVLMISTVESELT